MSESAIETELQFYVNRTAAIQMLNATVIMTVQPMYLSGMAMVGTKDFDFNI